jgi:hypothetical protein
MSNVNKTGHIQSVVEKPCGSWYNDINDMAGDMSRTKRSVLVRLFMCIFLGRERRAYDL